ncbi:hypothetical protein RRF57_001945 [Xylaria bambusicola]|uniref:Uncharacterized protein n=1 Tax=Xylaria bambusicola TaxID=326684 RepID=A0AAN7U678_9PEZI
MPPSIRNGYLFSRTQSSVLRIEYKDYDEHLRNDIYVPNTHFSICHKQSDHRTFDLLLSTVEFRIHGTPALHQAIDVDFVALAVGDPNVYLSKTSRAKWAVIGLLRLAVVWSYSLCTAPHQNYVLPSQSFVIF